MIKAILWDVDGTLLDFLPSERHSLKKAFLHFNLGECPDELVAKYSKINLKHWEMLERGEVTKAQICRIFGVLRYRQCNAGGFLCTVRERPHRSGCTDR